MAKGDKQSKEGKGKQKLTTKEKQDKKKEKEKAKGKQSVICGDSIDGGVAGSKFILRRD